MLVCAPPGQVGSGSLRGRRASCYRWPFVLSLMPAKRGDSPQSGATPEKVGLPLRPFLYSLDQLSVLLDVDETALKSTYIHFEGRSIGAATRHRMIARNIAPPHSPAEWRVTERELIRFLKFKGFRVYERSSVQF